MASLFLTNFWHFFYLPSHGPWYTGAVWGNVFVVVVLAPLGWLWSKTKFWPLDPLKHGLAHLHAKVDGLHARHDAHADSLASLHEKLDQLHEKHQELHQAIQDITPS